MAVQPNQRLAPYEILAAIGAGGMGEVYRDRDTRLERTVAIKILLAHLSSDPARKQRFEREARTIASLNHPHIGMSTTLRAADYLVLEFLEGETLAQRLRKSPLPLDQMIGYAIRNGERQSPG